MIRRISFHSMAEQEFNEATSYYGAESPTLAEAFLDDFEHALGQITRYPESAPLLNAVVRCKLLRRFPYSILYSLPPAEIRILAVANQKRRPFYWRGRR
jgi:toxin ParE1/3/4